MSFFAWSPAPGPLYQLITKTWAALPVSNPPRELVNWIPGQSPLSTTKEVVAAVATYLLIIFGGRELMR